MIHSEKAPTVGTLRLSGDLDLNRKDEIRKSLARLKSADIAILDFADVTYVDSTILGCLVVLRKRMLENGGHGIVRIVEPSKPLLKILTICGLDKIFEVSVGTARLSNPVLKKHGPANRRIRRE